MSLHNERRRRFIADDRSVESNDDAPVRLARATSDDQPASASYALGTRRDRSRQFEGLIPSGLLTIGLLTTIGLTLVAILVAAHVWTNSLAAALTTDEQALFDLAAPGNLSRWFASTLLGVAALVAIYIFSLRRHRLDDYNGRYRVWLWTVLGCFGASLCETTTAASVAQGLCARTSEACGVSPRVAWPALVGLALTAMGIRMLFEVWRARAAVAALMTAGLCLATTWTAELGLLGDVDETTLSAVSRGTWLVGYVLAATMFLLYGRHVIREIEGLVAVPARKPKRRKAKAETDDEKPRRDDSPPKSAAKGRTDLDPVSASDARMSRSTAERDEDDDDDSQDDRSRAFSGHPSLSRSERRRLRREAGRKAS